MLGANPPRHRAPCRVPLDVYATALVVLVLVCAWVASLTIVATH